MKSETKSERMIKKLDQLISELSDDDMLSLHAMSCVRGGSGEGGGVIPMIPPPPGP